MAVNICHYCAIKLVPQGKWPKDYLDYGCYFIWAGLWLYFVFCKKKLNAIRKNDIAIKFHFYCLYVFTFIRGNYLTSRF